MAYQTQKDINRVLQRDLEQERNQSKKREAELREEINELKEDNERQQNLIGQVALDSASSFTSMLFSFTSVPEWSSLLLACMC